MGRSVAACGSLVEAATALAQNHVDVHHAALLHVEGARVQLGDLLLAADGAVHAEVAGPAADAAGAAGAGVAIGQATASGPINSFANVLEQFLKLLQDRLRAAGVRNSSGLSIIAVREQSQNECK